MAGLIVKAEYNQAAKDFPQIAKRLPSLTAQALNRTATDARKAAVLKTAVELRLPVSIVNRRMTRSGSRSNARTQLTKRASYWSLSAVITVYRRGIPFFQISGAQTRRGVRGRGGRIEAGAFKVVRGRYSGIVFRRIRPRSEGSGKAQLEVPRISVRGPLDRHFEAEVTGEVGRARFRRFYAEQIRRELSKYGVRA